MPGSPKCLAIGEQDANVARVLVKLPAKNAADVRKALADIAEARVRLSELTNGRTFPVRIALTDEGGHGEEKLRKWADAVAKRLEKEEVAIDPDVFPGRAAPQTFVHVDREKLAKLGLKMADVCDTLQTAVGGLYVNDFNAFGRTTQVRIHSDAKGATPEDLKRLKLKSEKGEIVPLGSVAAFKATEAPPAALRVNLYPALRISAAVPPGKTAAEVTAKCIEIAEAERKSMKMPDAFKVVNLSNAKPR